MTTTPRLGAPLLSASQAQKHVTHNEALLEFDALLGCRILDRDLSAPPASPADGDAYLVKATGTGSWTGQDGNVAYAIDGAWNFSAPFEGLSIYVADEAAMFVYVSGSWQPFSNFVSLQNVPMVGVNTTADAANKLAVKSNAALFDAVPASGGGSGDMQVKLNKEAAADTGTFLFQTDYSGRAEFGLAGDDDFHVKVSPDGSAWSEAFVIDRSTGLVTAAADPTAALGLATKQYVDASGGGIGWPLDAGTLAADTPFEFDQTWNNAGVNFTGLKVDATDTASGSGSLLADFRLGGVSQASVSKAGQLSFSSLNFTSWGDIYQGGSSVIRIKNSAAGVRLGPSLELSSSMPSAGNVYLQRDADNVLALRNGTAAQKYTAYETYTSGANYSRMSLDAAKTSAGVNRLMSEAAGTGTLRPLAIDGYTKSGAPTATELPSGTWGLFKDSAGGTVVLAYNDGGTIKTVALA